MMLTMKIGVALSVLAAVGSAFGAGLRPLELKPLRLGSIRPEGWLKVQLEAMTEGLCGRLHERTGYLNVTNGWTPAPPTTLRKDRPTRFLQNEPSF